MSLVESQRESERDDISENHTPTTLIDALVEKVRSLPLDQQRVALDFVESLIGKSAPRRPGRSLYGAWSDLAVDLSEEEFQNARREMWAGFPREIEL